MTVHCSNVLWNSIEDFEIGLSGASLSFTDRLARENGWTKDFAERVIQEYRRFCFLAMTAGHPVTPSEQVDQAWHLHLLYTENYWTEFCGEVLPRPLHHGPTRGGRREGDKYRDWYQATLDSYATAFGEEPPADIWPGVSARFEDAHRFRRINTASHWVIAKPTGESLKRWLAPVFALPVLGACATSGGSGSLFLPAIGAIVIGLVLFGYLRDRSRARRRRAGRSDGTGAAGCSSGMWWWWGGSGDDSGDGNSGDGGSGCGSSGCGGGGCGGGCGSGAVASVLNPWSRPRFSQR